MTRIRVFFFLFPAKTLFNVVFPPFSPPPLCGKFFHEDSPFKVQPFFFFFTTKQVHFFSFFCQFCDEPTLPTREHNSLFFFLGLGISFDPLFFPFQLSLMCPFRVSHRRINGPPPSGWIARCPFSPCRGIDLPLFNLLVEELKLPLEWMEFIPPSGVFSFSFFFRCAFFRFNKNSFFPIFR